MNPCLAEDLTEAPTKVRVVIVDDTADIRILLRTVLEVTGRFEVVAEAGDGEEGVARVAEHLPDLVVLDLAMPVMDGLQALPLIRAASPDSIVVVLSAFGSERMAAGAVSLGAAGYIEKGLPPRALVQRLLAHLPEEA